MAMLPDVTTYPNWLWVPPHPLHAGPQRIFYSIITNGCYQKGNTSDGMFNEAVFSDDVKKGNVAHVRLEKTELTL
jgi:hypothetical protein